MENSKMENFAAQAIPSEMKTVRIGIEPFIALHNARGCVLVDVRVGYETAVWGVNIGLKIPADEIADRLDELPRDKTIVLACPNSDRSNIVRSYLAAQGFDAKYLNGGLLGLTAYLKGGDAKKLEL